MARFFIVTLNFAPEPSGFAPHVTALARHLADGGHLVEVFTGFPFAPEWRRRKADRGRFLGTEREGNLVVHRVTHFIPRRPSSAVQRIVMEGTFAASSLAAMFAALAQVGRPDVVLYVGAQPALAMAARWVATLTGRPYYVRITDLAARAALDVGIVGARLSGLLARFEFAAYRKAAGAAVLCSSFERDLVAYGYPPERILVLTNPIDVDRIRPVARDRRFRLRYRIPEDAFVVMHAGSMGLKQGLPNVIRAAAVTRDTRIHWVFVGDGEVRQELVDAVRTAGVESAVHFLPFQPDDELSGMFAAADVLLVNQIGAVKDTLIPGKLLTYMAAGKPVIVAASPESQAALLLSNSNGGPLVEPDNPHALAQAACGLEAADAATLTALGARNRAYAEQHFNHRRLLDAQERFLLQRVDTAVKR